MIRSALRYDLMGIIPRGESPWGWAPTIRFGMAADAISVSETTYLTAVRYYLANLGTTMESQVRSSVGLPLILSVCLPVLSPLSLACSAAIYPLLTLSLSPCASLCAAHPLLVRPSTLQTGPF